MYIKKSDNVIVISGKDKGKTGKVERVLRQKDAVIVEGVNIRKRHQKGRSAGKGQIVEFAAPVHVSNVALIDPKTKKPTRIGFEVRSGKKVRISKKSGAEI